MIPTYRPQENFLRETLGSVLRQDPGAAHMQIEVIDDCTPDTDVGALVRRLAGPRVRFRRTERNLGLAGCWNSCVAHAHGTWIHLLHHDDLVAPVFYAALERLVQRFPAAGAAFTRHRTIDEHGAELYLSPAESEEPAILPDWHSRLSAWQRLRCPAVVVRRDVYAQVGGFRTDLPFCLDWEMWARIAAVQPFAYSPDILAAHREHSRSETSRLSQTATTVLDFVRTFAFVKERLSPDRRPSVDAEFASHLEAYASPILPRLYAQGRYVELSSILRATARLPFSSAFRRQLREWEWKMKIKTVRNHLLAPFSNRKV